MMDTTQYWKLGSRIIAVGVFIFLILPLLVVIPLSFNGGSILSYPLHGLSLQWYMRIFDTPRWWTALLNSLIVGIATVAVATPMGTLASLGLANAKFPGKQLLVAVLLSPMIVPTITTAVGIYFFFAPLGLANTLTGLVLAHTALAVPFVLVTVGAALSRFDQNLLKAGASLGANAIETFWRVTLPIIMPGIASGAIFAFATSFDEVVIAMLLTGPGQRTLPRELLSGTRENLEPTVMAVATILILSSAALLFLMLYLQRRAQEIQARTSAGVPV